MEEEKRYWLWLCSVTGLYHNHIRQLIKFYGSPKAVYEASGESLKAWKAKGAVWVDRLMTFRKTYSVEEVCHRVKRKRIEFISCRDPDFPKRLKSIGACPFGLFYRGRLPKDTLSSVAVVGARSCSAYGKTMASALGRELAAAGAQVISGLAVGIDGQAQLAAVINGGASYGVLGCGVDLCYPKENQRLYELLWEKGGILSEFPPGTPPLPSHFPMRNRIISGLADAVVVVEARERSGSLITADLALEQGRDVYAVPGRCLDGLSLGCNRLIDQGAGMVVSVKGLVEALHLEQKTEKKESKNELGLAPEEKRVYSNLDLLPKGLEELARASNLPVKSLGGILVRLQLRGLAQEISKNHYARLK